MIYIVQNYPNGFLKCERIDEEKCVKNYIENEYPYNTRTYIMGFDSFINYMYCLSSHHIEKITSHGYIIRFWNNSSWIVVDAKNNFDAVKKARKILNDTWWHTDN